jgi:hypothetical protein
MNSSPRYKVAQLMTALSVKILARSAPSRTNPSSALDAKAPLADAAKAVWTMRTLIESKLH